jgi:ribose 5-phosphate isomerase B
MGMTIKLAITSDHGGFALKEFLKSNFKAVPVEWVDLGPDSEASVDYPDYGKKIADAIVAGDADRGIAICGTGIGISIAINRNPKVRAALCTDATMARYSQQHNNAQVLCLGARIVGTELAMDIVKAFLEAEFEGDRHQRRVDKLGNSCC